MQFGQHVGAVEVDGADRVVLVLRVPGLCRVKTKPMPVPDQGAGLAGAVCCEPDVLQLPENLPAPNTPIPAVICPNVRREMPVIGPEYHVMMFVDYAF
jgi:hypothetical protein